MKLRQPNIQLVKNTFAEMNIDEIRNFNIRSQINELDVINGVKGFKNYRYHVAKNPKLDADKNDLVMSVFCLLLEDNQHVQSVQGYTGRHIYYMDKQGRNLIAETDTMNSLQSDLNEFIKEVIELRFNEKMHLIYRRGAGISEQKIVEKHFSNKTVLVKPQNREKWLYNYLDEIFYPNGLVVDSQNYDVEIYALFNEWANYIHTFGNMMIGPIGFNAGNKLQKAKSKYPKDRLDLFLKGIKNDVSYRDEYNAISWQKHLTLLMETNQLNMYFDGGNYTSWDEANVIDIRKGSEPEEWMTQIINLIKARGELLAREIKQLLNS